MKKLDAKLWGEESKSPEKDLSNVESSLSIKFPEELNELLIEFKGSIFFHNGAQFKPEGKCVLAGSDGYLSMTSIYGISNTKSGILYVNKMYDDQLPNSVIIIAESDGGNQICIEKSTGKILYWNHEGTPDIDELFNIAPSFAEFLNKLEVEEDDDLDDPDLDDIECSLDF